MTPQGKGKGKVLRRTVELPAALRQELQDLGHLPAKGKGKLGRKEKRKAARDGAKAARAAHHGAGKGAAPAEAPQQDKGKGKRKAEDVETPAPAAKKSKSSTTSAAAPSPAPPAPAPHQTPLEKLLAKQERQSNPSATGRKQKLKTPQELAEDQEIAWLEAKLGVRNGDPNDKKATKGATKGEMLEDGLDDLFDGLDDLEAAAFGSSSKEYARLLRNQKGASSHSGSSGSSDSDEAEDEDEDEDDFTGIASDLDDQEQDSEDPFGENGISDDELRGSNEGDDDDHREMREVGSESDDEDEDEDDDEDWEKQLEEEIFGAGGAGEDDGDDQEEAEEGGMTMTFDAGSNIPSAASASTSAADAAAAAKPSAPSLLPKTKGAYVPPHLRAAAAAAAASAITVPPTSASLSAAPPTDPRLRRLLLSSLNKLSPLNLPSILTALLALYSSNPRAVVSATLTELLLEIIASRDGLGEAMIVSYAALVAGLMREVGVELAAGVVAKSIGMVDEALEKHQAARKAGVEDDAEGFEGKPGSKEALNLVAFVAELYNFGVVACVLIYDLVRLFIDSGRGLEELEVELLVKVVKRSGQQLRQDDPSALKEIINLVKAKQQGVDLSAMNSRTRFMVEALTNLKNNKTGVGKQDANGSAGVDQYAGLKKFLKGLKGRSGSTPEPLRITLADLRSSSTKGKWWLVGAAWAGDPLADGLSGPGTGGLSVASKDHSSDVKMAKLARSQGMNTDIRKGVFIVLMTSEDYVDACERLLQLGLSDVQEREIARVLLQCCGNEKTYNPYYTLVAHRMGTKSHGFTITLQYCLWDFLRELGEKKVGGEEMVKNIEDDGKVAKVSSRRITNLAKLYAWCVARDVLSLMILKPIPFGNPKPLTISFLSQFFTFLLISTQTPSPALILTATATRKDKEAIERVFVKAAPHSGLVKGLGFFFETAMEDAEEKVVGEKEKKVLKFGIKVAKETLSSSSGIVVDLR